MTFGNRRLALTALLMSPLTALAVDDLGSVTVTATRSEVSAQETPASISVITREDIQKQGATTVIDALSGVTGISLEGIGSGGRKTLSLRGMPGKHTLILIDGKRLPGSDDSLGPNTDYQFDWVPLDQIERIESVRGPMSVLYGSDALGGVINIITRPTGKQWRGDYRLTGQIGDHDHDGAGHEAAIHLGGALSDKLQSSIDLLTRRRASIESSDNPSRSALEGRDLQQAAFTLDWRPAPGHNLRLEHSSGNEDRWLDTATRRGKGYQSQYDIDRRHNALSWTRKTDRLSTTLRVYQSDIDVVNKATDGVHALNPQNLRERVAEGNALFPVGDHHLATIGIEQQTERLENPGLTGGSDDSRLTALYLQDEIELNDGIHLTLGVRRDNHRSFSGETSPRAAVVWNIDDRLTLKASYGHGFSAPTIKQTAAGYSFSAGPFVITSNPDLVPETNDALELAAVYTHGHLYIDGAIFHNKVENLIDTRFNKPLGGGRQEWIYDNISEATLQGLETTLRYRISDSLTLDAGYQYLNTEDGDGKRLQRRPTHTLSARIDWQHKQWNANLQVKALADQITKPPGKRTTVDLPDYSLWNAAIDKRINTHLQVIFSIENLADLRLAQKSPYFRHEEYPRTFKLSLRGEF